MPDIHFNNLDLNLLRIFDALLDERSVTRAGSRLGMSQSAVSHALNRLRHTLHDELFIRTAEGMRPTVRAIEMGPSIRSALANLQTALTPPVFEPASARRRFNVVAGPYACAVLLPTVVARLREAAPLVQLRVVGGADPRLVENLDAGDVDVAVVAGGDYPKRFGYETLFDDTMVWVARDGHPAAQAPITLEDLCALPHVVVAAPRTDSDLHPRAAEQSASVQAKLGDDMRFEAYLATLGLARTIAVTVPDTFSALAIISRTDAAGMVAWRLAEVSIQAGRVSLLQTPYSSPVGEIGLLFRRDRQRDPAQAWFVQLLVDAARALSTPKRSAA
jgi:DNA-binding transcriptional LysR family regulator